MLYLSLLLLFFAKKLLLCSLHLEGLYFPGVATLGIFDKNLNIFSLISGGHYFRGVATSEGRYLFIFFSGGGGRYYWVSLLICGGRYFWVSLLLGVATYLEIAIFGCRYFCGSLLISRGASLLLGVATYLGRSLLSGGRYKLVPRVSLLPALSSLQGVGRKETLGTTLGVATYLGGGGVDTFGGRGSIRLGGRYF